MLTRQTTSGPSGNDLTAASYTPFIFTKTASPNNGQNFFSDAKTELGAFLLQSAPRRLSVNFLKLTCYKLYFFSIKDWKIKMFINVFYLKFKNLKVYFVAAGL